MPCKMETLFLISFLMHGMLDGTSAERDYNLRHRHASASSQDELTNLKLLDAQTDSLGKPHVIPFKVPLHTDLSADKTPYTLQSEIRRWDRHFSNYMTNGWIGNHLPPLMLWKHSDGEAVPSFIPIEDYELTHFALRALPTKKGQEPQIYFPPSQAQPTLIPKQVTTSTTKSNAGQTMPVQDMVLTPSVTEMVIKEASGENLVGATKENGEQVMAEKNNIRETELVTTHVKQTDGKVSENKSVTSTRDVMETGAKTSEVGLISLNPEHLPVYNSGKLYVNLMDNVQQRLEENSSIARANQARASVVNLLTSVLYYYLYYITLYILE